MQNDSGSILEGEIRVSFEIILFLLKGLHPTVGAIVKSMMEDVKFSYFFAYETKENC